MSTYRCRFSRLLLIATLTIAVSMFSPYNPPASAQNDSNVHVVNQGAEVNRHRTHMATCHLVRIRDNNVVGYVTGQGRTSREALADANSNVPRGHYKRHCRITVVSSGSFAVESTE